MDEFIFVLLAGLLMIAILLIAWGVPEEGVDENGTQIIIEDPFSIGVFPTTVPRQISFGDFEVSYAIGSEVIESKRDIEIRGRETFSMSGEIIQDMDMVTGGFITIYVRETNGEGSLVVTVNGEEVFNQVVTVGKVEVPLDKEELSDYNIIEISTQKSAWKFWAKSYYKIDKIDFGANFYGNVAKTEEFHIYPEELRDFVTAEIGFRLNQAQGDGDLMISINGNRLFKGRPSLDFHHSFTQHEAGLTNGLNSISFSTESGGKYEIEDSVLTIIRSESAKKSRSFDFTVGRSYNDNLEGEISFYISDTDYRGNLIITITDTSGNKHPVEAIQSYASGQTKKVNFNNDHVNSGDNIVTFEATDGSFVISNVEISPR
jgi:hypothetical protein